MSLPTEIEWEYACRAGTTTPWWTGPTRESLISEQGIPSANIADVALRKAGYTRSAVDDWPDYFDGAANHAPVNWYRPNAFGLFNTQGNVWEWCLDPYRGYKIPPLKDPEALDLTQDDRVMRGGGFFQPAHDVRSSRRMAMPPNTRRIDLGVRPVIRLQ